VGRDGGIFATALGAAEAAAVVEARAAARAAAAAANATSIPDHASATAMGAGGLARAVAQATLLRHQQVENQVTNFSSTYMDESALRQPTPTSADGSRRRMVVTPWSQHPHRSEPSKFWQLAHAATARDIFPCEQRAMRDPWARDTHSNDAEFVNSYSLLRHLARPASAHHASTPGGAAAAAAGGRGSSRGSPSGARAQSASPPRFKATSPVAPASPTQILRARQQHHQQGESQQGEGGGYRLRGRPGAPSSSSSTSGTQVTFQPPEAVARTARRRASSAPAGVRQQMTVGDVVFGQRQSVAAEGVHPSVSVAMAPAASSERESGGGEAAPGMLRWASKTLADFIGQRTSSAAASSSSSGYAGAGGGAGGGGAGGDGGGQQARYSLRRGAAPSRSSLGDVLAPDTQSQTQSHHSHSHSQVRRHRLGIAGWTVANNDLRSSTSLSLCVVPTRRSRSTPVPAA